MVRGSISSKAKRGQIEITFNWIYVLVAGAVILLFFALIIVQQKSESEERLASDVIIIMKSILSGAGVSENTQNSIDTSTISDYTLYFSCAEGVGELGIVGKGVPVQDNINPLFAPSQVKTTRVMAWSLPFKFPYKVMDFLMVTSANAKYFVVGNTPLAEEFTENAHNFTVEKLSREELADAHAGAQYQVRVVDFDGTAIVPGAEVPVGFRSLADDKVTAVSFTGRGQVFYFQKKGRVWERLHADPLPLLALGGERDAATYASIFAADDQAYRCNLHKALRRLKLVTAVYQRKLAEMESYHGSSMPRISHPLCYDLISGSATPQLHDTLLSFTTRINSCLATFPGGYAPCSSSLVETAQSLASLNERLYAENCLPLY